MYNGGSLEVDDAIFVSFNQEELTFGRYDIYDEKEINIEKLYCTITQENKSNFDYICNNLDWLVVSEKAKQIIEKSNIGRCKFIPVFEKETDILIGYLVYILDTVEALDEENSLCVAKCADGTVVITRYAIHTDKVQNLDLFRLKEDTMIYFISDKLRKTFLKEGLKGFAFQNLLSNKEK